MKEHWFLRVVKWFSLLMCFQNTFAISFAFFIGDYMARIFHLDAPFISALWCAISTVLVMQAAIHEAYQEAWLRIIGSFFGGLVGGIFCHFFGYHVWVLWLSLFVTVFLVSALKMNFSFRLACLTVIVIIATGLNSLELAPWKNALARFIQPVLGTGIAVVLSWIFYPIRKKYNLFNP